MGKYDVTTSQYAQFLNAVAATDPYGLYSTTMAPGPQLAYCGIVRNGSPGSYSYSVMPGRENFPVSSLSWGDAARFCNWLANGQVSGAEGPGTTETGSYTLDGAMTDRALTQVDRSLGARYVIPTNDEWYKAAYHVAGTTAPWTWLYPTQSDQTPSNAMSSTGTNNANYAFYYHYAPYWYTDPVNYLTPVGAFAASPGPYGTFDMGGDVEQWTEGRKANGTLRGVAGGSFADEYFRVGADSNPNDLQPTADNGVSTGFRIALVPEPMSVLLVALGGARILIRGRVGR